MTSLKGILKYRLCESELFQTSCSSAITLGLIDLIRTDKENVPSNPSY